MPKLQRSRSSSVDPAVRQAAWSRYLTGIALLTAAYVLAHFCGPKWLNSGPVYNVIGGSAVVALIIGARRNKPTTRLPWYLFALGQAFFVTGDVLSYNYQKIFGTPLPFPSIADGFYLAFYPLLIAGLLLLIRERTHDARDRASLIDALILTIGLGAVAWVYLMAPYTHDSSIDIPTMLTSIAYPLMDVLVLGVVLRMAVGGGHRGRAFGFLVTGGVMLLLTDSIYGWIQLHGGYTTGGVLDAGWAAFYALLGASALHPSMRRLTEPAGAADGRLTKPRLALLALASLTAPALLIVRAALNQTRETYVLSGAAAALFVLVIMRMTGIVHRHKEAGQREAALRLAGEGLVTSKTHHEVYAVALHGARSLLHHDATVRVHLSESGDGPSLPVVAGTEADLGAVPPLALHELPAELLQVLHERGVVELDGADGPMWLAPLLLRDQLRGVLAVLPQGRLSRTVEGSLAVLAVEVGLALDTIALTEAAVTSEARLSSLVRNASDVVCIVDEDSTLRYVSPSIERILGHVPEALRGRQLVEIVHPGDVQRMLAFLATISTQPVFHSSVAEFRVRHRQQGWRDVEAVATNLVEDQAIEGLVVNIRDISERKAFEAELEHQAFHDTLTGLPNRALFRNRVEQALASHLREGSLVTIMFLDIDDFKNVNDSLGHAAGDELLREVAQRLDSCVRSVDTAARLGGDEFALLILSSDSEMQSIEIAERVMNELAVTLPLEGRDIVIRTSVGITFSGANRQGFADADELLRDADTAMYMAKQNGKGGYQIFEPEMQAQALARLELKADLERALESGEFTLRYQPIMDLAAGELAGMEALVRWEHPVRGMVMPMDFIPLAEDTGVVLALGRHVLREACLKAAEMQKMCPRNPPLWISVNVSARQLQSPHFVEEVRTVLAETGVAPGSLILELTESVMMHDVDLSVLRMDALRALGVRLAIDDFGTGYSSLNYIRQFPFDVMKIDRSFLSDPNPQVIELTAAIVDLARIFKLQAVAEGIENVGQLTSLQGMNCEFGQGFHFAKPLSEHEIVAMAVQMQQASEQQQSAA